MSSGNGLTYSQAVEQVLGYVPDYWWPDTSYTSQTGVVSQTFNLTNVDSNNVTWNIQVQIGTPIQATCYLDGTPLPKDSSGNFLPLFLCSMQITGINPTLWGVIWGDSFGNTIANNTICVAYGDSNYSQAAAQGLAQGILSNIPFTGTVTGLNQLVSTPPLPSDLVASATRTSEVMLASTSNNTKPLGDCGCGKKAMNA